MRRKIFEILENHKKEAGVSITADFVRDDAQEMARRLAVPRNYAETKGTAIERAARSVRVSPGTFKSLIYGELTNVPAHVYFALRESLHRAEANARAAADLEKIKADAAERLNDAKGAQKPLTRTLSEGIKALEASLEQRLKD